jgi:hypothetical protein
MPFNFHVTLGANEIVDEFMGKASNWDGAETLLQQDHRRLKYLVNCAINQNFYNLPRFCAKSRNYVATYSEQLQGAQLKCKYWP